MHIIQRAKKFLGMEYTNPLTKHSPESCRELIGTGETNKKFKNEGPHKQGKKKENHTSNNQFNFQEEDSLLDESPVIKYSKAFLIDCNTSSDSPYLNLAASSHMAGDSKEFINYKPKVLFVGTVDGSCDHSLGSGNVVFTSNGSKFLLKFINVPNLKETLISMGKL
ncbi:hypothetical protein O181_014232 [Austropuccinia psidii MF-1]|uniref:Retrovirus-related Pol polyprotein from transposon TNT 1-94-like beta-barrel domain-containing protein n=1 Tax=Austropuccinia psidii MF-1 TaxID=1389203 RepID=A0A9Q3BZT5_9BASI|nr:hypothetical protein [Austropuccinia psidii MF-1]